MTCQKIKALQEELRKEKLKCLKLRMRLAVLIQHPKGMAAEKITDMTRADFSESIVSLN